MMIMMMALMMMMTRRGWRKMRKFFLNNIGRICSLGSGDDDEDEVEDVKMSNM